MHKLTGVCYWLRRPEDSRPEQLQLAMELRMEAAGLRPLGAARRIPDAGGYFGVWLLAEGHAALRCYPEAIFLELASADQEAVTAFLGVLPEQAGTAWLLPDATYTQALQWQSTFEDPAAGQAPEPAGPKLVKPKRRPHA